MSSDAIRKDNRHAAIVVIGMAVVMITVLAFNPSARWPAPYPREDLRPRHLVYVGPDAVTVTAPDLDPAAEARAAAALQDASFHAAYAEGTGGRSGTWTGAHTPELARAYALAACGNDCRVLAERHPAHAAQTPEEDTLILSPEMARRIGERWPYVGNGHALAVGGAGAWGTGHAGGRTGEFHRAVFRAVAECEARRLDEPTPEGLEPPPCRSMSLREAEIIDLRPERSLYPADYEVAPARLVVVEQEALRLMDADGVPLRSFFRNRLPVELHGARARNGEGARALVRAGGWPEAAAELALDLCEAQRRFEDPPCAIVARRMPPGPLPDGTLAVTPGLMEAFRAWEATRGAGAFAIGALGVWGTSYNYATLEEARQAAADWCAYYAQRGNRPFTLRRAFVDQPPCRIIAERAD